MLERIRNMFGNKNTSSDMPDLAERKRIEYALELEQSLCELEAHLHESDDSAEIIQRVMQTACRFYEGDWVGFLEADLELGLWAPYVWYSTNPADRTAQLLQDVESTEFLDSWITSMHDNTPIIIQDVDTLKVTNPVEYDLYHRLGIKNALAVPVKPRPTGYLVVRNPKRYTERSSMLQMLAFVVLASVNEQKLFQSMKMRLTPEKIERDTDVIINLFGNLEIYTSKGVLREADLKSPKICRLLTYMVLNKKKTIPAWEMAEVLWPEETAEADNPGKNLRALIYRLRQSFMLISDYQLIETTANGYCFNQKLNIMTDIQLFDRYWRAAQQTTTVSGKVEILREVMKIYKGNILSSADSEHWLMPTASHYNLLYIGMVNELLKTLESIRDYHNLHEYAAQALTIEPGNAKAYYWLILAMCNMGASEMAKTQVEIAHEHLTDEEYQQLIDSLREMPISPVNDLFRSENLRR